MRRSLPLPDWRRWLVVTQWVTASGQEIVTHTHISPWKTTTCHFLVSYNVLNTELYTWGQVDFVIIGYNQLFSPFQSLCSANHLSQRYSWCWFQCNLEKKTCSAPIVGGKFTHWLSDTHFVSLFRVPPVARRRHHSGPISSKWLCEERSGSASF